MSSEKQGKPWTKGGPSPNPRGRGVSKAFSSASVPGPTRPAGSDAVAIYGGFITNGERRRELVSTEKWKTYDNLTLNVAIIASAVNIWTQLGGSAKWTAEPNERGGKNAQRAADIVTEGLLDAQMSKPWRQVVRRQIMKKFRGFAMHEAIIRRRHDGKIIFGDIQHRPQWSVFRWDKPDEQTPWQGIEQLTRSGRTFYIPRERLLYSVEDTLTDSPDGVGVLRQLAESARVLEVYRTLEGIGLQNDLRGMPVIKAPLGLIRQNAISAGVAADDETAISAYIDGATKWARDFLEGHSKTPDQGMLLPSDPFYSLDAAKSPSGVLQWSFDIVKGATSSMPEVGAAIARVTRDIAQVMCAEWLLLGSADAGGAYSMHADKTAMFGQVINSTLGDIADDAERDLAARLVALNGMDPETCTPRLVVEPIATGGVEYAAKTLMMLAQAGLHPEDEAGNIIRSRMDLPPAPAVDLRDWVLPRGAEIAPDTGATAPGAKPPGTAAAPGASAAPASGKPAASATAPGDGAMGNQAATDGKTDAAKPKKRKGR